MIQRDDDEGVADFFVGDEFRDFRDRHKSRHGTVIAQIWPSCMKT
jgi:hypothetical protein